GQLGVVASGAVLVPVPVSAAEDQTAEGGMRNIVDISAGVDHTMLQVVTTVKPVVEPVEPEEPGEDDESGEIAEPVAPVEPAGPAELTMTAYAMGSNAWGQLGQGGLEYNYACNNAKCTNKATVVGVSAATMKCPNCGQEMVQSHVGGILSSTTPLRVKDTEGNYLTDVRQVSAGNGYSLALTADLLLGGTIEPEGVHDSLLYAWGRNDEGQLGQGESDGKGGMNQPVNTSLAAPVRKGGTVSMVEIVGYGEKADDGVSDRKANYIRENLLINAGYLTTQLVQEDGTVWFTGENYHHEGADFTTVDKSVPTQTGLGTYYSLVIGKANIYQWDDLINPVHPVEDPTGTWTWPPKTVTNRERMPRSVTMYDDQYLYIEEQDLRQAFSSGFNLIDAEFERRLPSNAIIEYTSSDPSIADFKMVNGKLYLVPTGESYGRIIITLRNKRDMYWGDYEVIILPTDNFNGVIPEAAVSVIAAGNANVALQADGTVWQWGEFQLRIHRTDRYDYASYGWDASSWPGVTTGGQTLPQNGLYKITIETPAQVKFPFTATGEHIVQVEGYNRTFMALSNLGNVYTWGSNDYGQLGNGTYNDYHWLNSNYDIEQYSYDTLTPVRVSNLGPGTEGGIVYNISMGNNFALAVGEGGYVWAWGLNNYGQQGTDTVGVWRMQRITRPYSYDDYRPYSDSHEEMIQFDDGTWGYDKGDEKTVKDIRPMVYTTPHKVLGLESLDFLKNITRVAAGDGFALALRSDSTLFAWGRNDAGQLGINAAGGVQTHAVQVRPGEYDPEAAYLRDVIEIDAASGYAMALMRNGEVYTWGSDANGQLGNDAVIANSSMPVRVAIPENMMATAIYAGENSAMVIASPRTIRDESAESEIPTPGDESLSHGVNNRVYAWGMNNAGQLGDGTKSNDPVAVPVLVLAGDNLITNDDGSVRNYFSTAITVATAREHSVLVDWEGRIYITGDYNWGKYDGDAGDALITDMALTPDRFGAEDAKMYRWYKTEGTGSSAKLVRQPSHITMDVLVSLDSLTEAQRTATMPTPVKNTLDIPFSEMYQDYDYTYSLRHGADRLPFDLESVPYLVLDSSDSSVARAEVYYDGGAAAGIRIISVSPGEANIYIRNASTGFSMLLAVNVTEVSLALNAKATPMLDSGLNFSIALKANGTVWAWGTWGRYISDNTDYSDSYSAFRSAAPTQITGWGSGVYAVQVAAGYDHALILLSDGTVWAVGQNDYGQLGNNDWDYARYSNSSFDYWHIASNTTNAVRSGAISNIGQVAAGGYYSAAVDKTTGEVYVWGRNYFTETRGNTLYEGGVVGTGSNHRTLWQYRTQDGNWNGGAIRRILTSPTKLKAGYSASHTETVSGSVGYQHNEYLTSILQLSASHTALYLMRMDG
ncbi:MAG: hypothetical protein NC311_17080, partial [Muribaculaceae bacterium]|nr:hypothetical protein [Muribaculaceae bacterium]